MSFFRSKKKEVFIVLSALCVFFLALLLGLFVGDYSKYAMAFLPFGLSLLLLTIAFLLLKLFSKDRTAKSHKFPFLTNWSAKLAEKENRLKAYLSFTTIILFIVFFARFYFFKGNVSYVVSGNTYIYKYYDYLHLQRDLIGDGLYSLVTFSHLERSVSTLLNDWWKALIVFALVCAFYLGESSIRARRYIGTPIAILITVFFSLCVRGIVGDSLDYRVYLMGIELGFLDFYYFSSFFEKEKFTCNRKQILSLLALSLPFLISSMSAYTPANILGQTIFGLGNPHKPADFTHRCFLYLSFLLPICYYLTLSPLSEKEKRSALIQISLGSFFGYISINRFDIWSNLSHWPLHLCCTAMYTMPLTLLWKNYWLYYFTFFINVLGAFLALLMPNFSSSLPLFSPHVMEFYINHLHAFFMPVLIVLLGIYKRPKIKYFVYSQIGFLLYFAFVMFVNVYLTAHGTESDFFFINSDFVADKLGQWAENIFNATISFELKGHTYVIHLMYDVAYYVVYIFLALGMWFVYELLFRIIDERNILVLTKQKSINRHEAYLLYKEKGGIPMSENKVFLKVTHLSKKYHGAGSYAVKDFSMNLEGGKIYGFLGKNGAGKSTIIKSIVGIHGFEEGYINVCGYDVVENPLKTKELIGFVPDNYALYENLTGRQYINYIADLYGVSKEDRIKKEEDLVKRIELSERYDKPMKTYSHGMKQKITIIAALIHDPKVWILDEPMTGLDPNSIYQIKECMKEHAKKGNIVFFSSHIIDVVKNLCDEVIIIKHGELIQTINLDEHPEEREMLEKKFLILTSDNKEEEKALLEEEAKGEVI